MKVPLALIVLILDPVLGHNYQSIECFDGQGCQGESLNLTSGYIVDLGQPAYGFDNRISSCQIQRVFVLYDGVFFNNEDTQVIDWSLCDPWR